MTLRAVAALFAAIQQAGEQERTIATSPKPSLPGRTQMGKVIDFEKAQRFRELARQSHVLEQDIHAKLDLLHQVNVGLGNLVVELLHGEALPEVGRPALDRLNGESGLDG